MPHGPKDRGQKAGADFSVHTVRSWKERGSHLVWIQSRGTSLLPFNNEDLSPRGSGLKGDPGKRRAVHQEGLFLVNGLIKCQIGSLALWVRIGQVLPWLIITGFLLSNCTGLSWGPAPGLLNLGPRLTEQPPPHTLRMHVAEGSSGRSHTCCSVRRPSSDPYHFYSQLTGQSCHMIYPTTRGPGSAVLTPASCLKAEISCSRDQGKWGKHPVQGLEADVNKKGQGYPELHKGKACLSF